MEAGLPDNLRNNIKKVKLRALQVLLLTTLFAAIALFGASILLLYISDRFWATPPTVRLLIQLITLGCFLAFVFKHIRYRNSLTKDRSTVLKLVQRYFPKLGDGLQGAVEIADGEHKGMSESLCNAAVKQVADQTEGLDFNAAVSTKRRNKSLKYLTAAVAVIAVCLTIDYKALLNTAERWALPLADIERYTFINIQEMKSTHYVEHGKDFELPVFIDEASRFSASTLKYKFAGTSLKESAIVDNKAILELKGQTEKTSLHLYAGDSSKVIKIVPILPPAIVGMKYKVSYPEYLNKDVLETVLKGTQLDILEGSKFSLSATTSSELSAASFSVVKINDEGDETSRSAFQQLKVQGRAFLTNDLVGGDKYVFRWKDTYNFSNRKDRQISVNYIKDSEPFADIPNAGKDNYILGNRNYPVNISCEDDFGLKSIGVEYQVEIDGNKGEWQQTVLRRGQSDSKSLSALYILNAEKINAPVGSSVHIRAIARDYYPERKWSVSASYSYNVISQEEHAQMIQDKLNQVLARIEEAILREESNRNKNTVLSQQNDEKIDSESSDSAIDNQITDEQANAEELKSLAEEGKKAVEMAKENSLFNEEELAKIEQSMDSVKGVAENMMPAVSEKLSAAAESQGLKLPEQKPGESRQENLEDAVAEQEKVLAELRKASAGAQEASKNAELEIMAQRLKALATLERAVASDTEDIFNMAPGITSEKLKVIVHNMLKSTSVRQTDILNKVNSLRNEIYSFYDKTGFEEYNKVHTDMDKVGVADGMTVLVSHIDQSQTFTSRVLAKRWSVKFDEWAKWLTKEQDGAESEGGGGESQPGELDELLAAIFDIIINEQQLREDTKKAYNQKSLKNYITRTEELAAQQAAIGKDLAELIPIAPPDVSELLVKAGEFMLEAKKELGEKHDAGQTAINAESGAMEVLKRAFELGCGQ